MAARRVELRKVRGILSHYCQALAATEVQIRSTEELSQRGIGWSSVEEPTTEGTTIFLPPIIQEAETKRGNFESYKVLATHQAAHLEFGTFRFSLARKASLFKDFRPALQKIVGHSDGALTDFEGFFDLFRDRRLATDVFTVVEDGRIDFALKDEYNGIRQLYGSAQESSLAKRPPQESLPLRETLLEILIQVSIGSFKDVLVPQPLILRVEIATSILRRVQAKGATVEDAAEASVRLYCLLQQVPNLPSAAIPAHLWHRYDLSEAVAVDDDQLEGLLYRFFSSGEEIEMVEEESPYTSPKHVGFRGDLKPELAQTLIKLGLREGEYDGSSGGEKATYDALKELFSKNVEMDASARSISSPAAFARNVLKERGRSFLSGDLSRRGARHAPARIPRSKANGTGQVADFVYDEWDYLANCYKPDWCHLKQRVLEEGTENFFYETLHQYAGLVLAVRKEFEHLKTERFRKVKRLHDGDDVDFDAVVDAIVEKKAGVPFSDRVYWRRKKLERDVCVTFLLDMSASTYERISGAPATGAIALAKGKWSGKRIIDLEKEAIVVLIEALEAIGDAYGIYGFSGHGRDNVEFAIIKDIEEEISPIIRRRIARITPIQGTRMGPAIRHLSAILEGQEAKTKLLVLISDGRPQDHDYGGHHAGEEWSTYNHLPNMRLMKMDEAAERMRKEYAIYDTRMALLEARQRSITPFCLTIDKTGHDYLRAMCGDIGYEVLDDIYALPRRLPTLYRRLTARV